MRAGVPGEVFSVRAVRIVVRGVGVETCVLQFRRVLARLVAGFEGAGEVLLGSRDCD